LLNSLAESYNLPVIVSTHPRTRIAIDQNKVVINPLIQLLKPLGFIDYNHLQQNAKVVLSDSGTISEESSILNFPAINIRDAHERPEAMEEGAVVMTGFNLDRIDQAIIQSQEQFSTNERTLHQVKDYSYSNVSDKVLRIVLSYTDYVNRVVWQK